MLNIKFLRVAIAIVVMFAFISCATIIRGTKQEIQFESTPKEAKITVVNLLDEEVGNCVTPCALQLAREGGNYWIKIDKEGYMSANFVIEMRWQCWGFMIADIFLGIIPGLIDSFNGACNKLVPKQINATLTPQSSSQLKRYENQYLISEADTLLDEECEKNSELN